MIAIAGNYSATGRALRGGIFVGIALAPNQDLRAYVKDILLT
jgi:hypothetical protein